MILEILIWVILQLKFNEKYENLVGVGDSVDQKDAVEKAVCCLLNELEKSGLIDNKNKTKSVSFHFHCFLYHIKTNH